LVLAARRILAAKPEPEEKADDADPEERWDADRVSRHLERAVGQGYQLLQRARWLCLIRDCLVRFQEPNADDARWLSIVGGRAMETGDTSTHEAPAVATVTRRSWSERRHQFDRHEYDRLRTLTTELKRIARDGGKVAVRLPRGRWLDATALEQLLRWV
jgi:hypothetical protein